MAKEKKSREYLQGYADAVMEWHNATDDTIKTILKRLILEAEEVKNAHTKRI